MKKVLMIALEFPPCRSAGVQRTLRFTEYLPDFQWQPLVVTATDNIYEQLDLSVSLPEHLDGHIVKAKCKDAAKHYGYKGKYFYWMTLPDRYWPWYFDAVKQASKLIEQHKPDIIWSTYPVLTTHLIAKKLHNKYNIPWVADYRDPLQCHYDKSHQPYAGIKKRLEKKVVAQASKVVFTAERAADFYRELYPEIAESKFVSIENGFQQSVNRHHTLAIKPKKFTLLYSGMLYANGRDPEPLFKALALLKQDLVINKDTFTLNFRATKGDYSLLLKQLDIVDLVNFLPAFSFAEALAEMQTASANLLIQDGVFQRQIPGKIYEYISVRKPVLALTPNNSATYDVVQGFGYGFSAYGVTDIANKIKYLLENNIDCNEDISQYSRKNKTAALADLFDSLVP